MKFNKINKQTLFFITLRRFKSFSFCHWWNIQRWWYKKNKMSLL